MKLILNIFICIFLFFTACKKNKDIVATKNINGMLFNNCTDSGLANVTVFLQDGQGLNLSTVSGANGNFSFNNVQIHSNAEYNYVIYIPSKSGTNATTFEYCGFDGTRLYFNNDEADIFFKPRVTPSYLFFTVYCNKIPFTNTNDSIIFYCNNYTFHKNVPNYPYGWGGGYGDHIYFDNVGNYPMGKYNIDIDIWKSGVHTTKKDSVYLSWGANTSYTINW